MFQAAWEGSQAARPNLWQPGKLLLFLPCLAYPLVAAALNSILLASGVPLYVGAPFASATSSPPCLELLVPTPVLSCMLLSQDGHAVQCSNRIPCPLLPFGSNPSLLSSLSTTSDCENKGPADSLGSSLRGRTGSSTGAGPTQLGEHYMTAVAVATSITVTAGLCIGCAALTVSTPHARKVWLLVASLNMTMLFYFASAFAGLPPPRMGRLLCLDAGAADPRAAQRALAIHNKHSTTPVQGVHNKHNTAQHLCRVFPTGAQVRRLRHVDHCSEGTPSQLSLIHI